MKQKTSEAHERYLPYPMLVYWGIMVVWGMTAWFYEIGRTSGSLFYELYAIASTVFLVALPAAVKHSYVDKHP